VYVLNDVYIMFIVCIGMLGVKQNTTDDEPSGNQTTKRRLIEGPALFTNDGSGVGTTGSQYLNRLTRGIVTISDNGVLGSVPYIDEQDDIGSNEPVLSYKTVDGTLYPYWTDISRVTPANAKYVVLTPSVELPSAFSLSTLGSGLLVNNPLAPSMTIAGVTGTGNVVQQTTPTIVNAILQTPSLGEPQDGNLAHCANLPSSGISDGTGTGVVARQTNAQLITPNIGTPSAGVLTNCGGLLPSGLSITTGTGAVVCMTSPTLVTPYLGTPGSGTLTNCNGLLSAGIADGSGTGVVARVVGPTFTTPNLGTPSAATLTNCNGLPSAGISDGSGTGVVARVTNPAFTTPDIGTPSSGTLTNCTGLPSAGISDGSGTGVVARVTNAVLTTPNIGTPSAGTLSNCTELPATGLSGLATNMSAFLTTGNGTSLYNAISAQKSGTGNLLFGTSPVLVTPQLGTPASGTLTNCTGLKVTSGVILEGTGSFTVNLNASSNTDYLWVPTVTWTGNLTNATSVISITVQRTAAWASNQPIPTAISWDVSATPNQVWIHIWNSTAFGGNVTFIPCVLKV